MFGSSQSSQSEYIWFGGLKRTSADGLPLHVCLVCGLYWFTGLAWFVYPMYQGRSFYLSKRSHMFTPLRIVFEDSTGWLLHAGKQKKRRLFAAFEACLQKRYKFE